MSDRPCPLCGAALTSGAVICGGCTNAVRVDLRAVPDVLDDLDVTLSRQGSAREASGDTCPEGCDHDPDSPTCRQGVTVDLDEGASRARLALVTCLHGWVRVWDEETPRTYYGGDGKPLPDYLQRRIDDGRDAHLATPQGQAAILARCSDLGARDWAADLAAEVGAAVRQARRAVDCPPGRVFLGWCPGEPGGACGRALYAPEGRPTVACPGCGCKWDVEAGRVALMAAGDETLAPALDLARALRVPLGTMRRWRHDGWLKPAVGDDGKPLCNRAGQPLYRFADAHRLVQGNTPGRRPARHGDDQDAGSTPQRSIS